jgi:peptide/nickel transport system ATP-binding protein/oligopeptide transport system ATP-binding protein
MYMGRIVEVAKTEDLFESPLHPYTKALISSIPIPDPLAKKNRIILSGEVPSPIDPPVGCRFETRCSYKKDQSCIKNIPKLIHVGNEHFVSCEKTKKSL